jgi:isoleucyl-tRNA synthetase
LSDKVNHAKWTNFYNLKNIVYSELEKIRTNKVINKNNQAVVNIQFKNEFKFTEAELAKYLNVAKVHITNTNDETMSVTVDNANLIRCERCWNYFDKDEMHDEQICHRCDTVINRK